MKWNFNILEFLQDDKGFYSNIRVVTFLSFCFIMAYWGWGIWLEGKYISLDPWSAGMLAYIIGAKIAQKGIESKNGNDIVDKPVQ